MNPTPPVQIVPSILSADFGRLDAQVRAAADAGADRFQVDIMDGHFVPNISMGPMFIGAVRAATSLPIEAHLMVTDPGHWAEECVRQGANVVIAHAEATPHLNRVLQQISTAGALPAVALNPASPLELIDEVLGSVSMVLLMTVNPGFGGQRFIEPVLDKIQRLRRRFPRDIEVDGGVDAITIAQARGAGANVFVAGTSVFSAPDGIAAATQRLRAAAGQRFNAAS